MTEHKLREFLTAEVCKWASKPFDQIVAELADVQAYELVTDGSPRQFEVMLVENTSEYIHVVISADDGSLKLATRPLSSSFILYRNGGVEI